MIHLDNPKLSHSSIDRLLRPQSVALVGASAKPGSLGQSVLLNLENAQYSGELYLINPKHPVIRGRPCLASIDDIPAGVDCAVLAIPGSAVIDAARACARQAVGSLIVFSAGFAEGGEAGKAAQRELAEIARESNLIIEGPNCLGMVNYIDGIPLTFVATPPQERCDWPGVAIISQSGALAAVLAVNLRHHGMPLTYSISTGNEVACGVEDFLEHLINIIDEHTRVFALVVEQFRSPKRFLNLVRRAWAAGKRIVLLHPGSSHRARVSAATHTGAMVGNYEVMRTLVTHAGVIHVETLEELVDVSQILVRCLELPRGGAAVFTESGAFKALTLDLCERIGLGLPEISGKTYQRLREALPPFIPVSNPVDVTAQALVDPSLYGRTLPPILEEEQFGSVMLGIILTDSTTTALKMPAILDAIRRLKPDKLVIFAPLDEGAPCDAAAIRELRQLGVACFPSPERAIRALAHVTRLGCRDLRRRVVEVQPSPMLSIGSGMLPEYRSKELLKELGVVIPEGGLARSLDEALVIARRIGFPLALKAQAVELPHKSDVGGVVLGIASEDALTEGWVTLHRNLSNQRPGLKLDGVLVERMSQKGVELILGARNDPDWGPVLLAGFGGILAEAMNDTRLFPADLSKEAIVEELTKLRSATLLRGFRSTPALDIGAAAEIVAALGQLIRSAPRIIEIDVNPVVLYAQGSGAVALDALIVADDE
ncbi:MAG: acetate--CoA ligase family protein [Candidatus Sulfotelmatobacter sp.]